MATLTARSFQTVSELADGRNFFCSNLMIADEVVHISSSVNLVDGEFSQVECICCETQSFRRDNEIDIRKAIAWLLNNSAASLVLDCGITVFVPKAFNLKH